MQGKIIFSLLFLNKVLCLHIILSNSSDDYEIVINPLLYQLSDM